MHPIHPSPLPLPDRIASTTMEMEPPLPLMDRIASATMEMEPTGVRDDEDGDGTDMTISHDETIYA